jgi:uncharacterized protein DUF3455
VCTRLQFRRPDHKEHDMNNCTVVLGLTLLCALPSAAQAQTVTPPSVPAGLEVEAPNQAFLVGHAFGTQNYECQPTDALGHVAWTLFTPQATLFSDQDEQIITHFNSPNPDENRVVRATWQDSADSSRVWARAVAAATVDPDAIPWVKLVKVGAQVGPTGGRTLSDTTFVQRVNTRGGLAPSTGCDQLPDVGKKAFMPYTADYFFYKQ